MKDKTRGSKDWMLPESDDVIKVECISLLMQIVWGILLF